MTNVQVKIMTKVYFFANCHSCPGEQSGGDRRFREILKRLVDFDRIIITSKFGLDIYAKDVGQAKYLLTSEEEQKKNILLSYLMRTIKSLLLNLKISDQDILYSTSDFLPDVFPAFIWKLRSRNKKCKWVQVIFHVIPPPIQRGGPFITNLTSFSAQRLSFHLIRRSANLIFVLNDMVRDQLVKLGFSKNRIFVTGAGIDLSQIDEIQRAEGMDYDACFLGRLHSSKGIFDLIEIWKLVVSKKKNVRLAIIYVGPKYLESALMNRIKEENLDSNVFMLSLIGKDALGVVKSSKVFVFPSHEEGWGIAICEAMACGLPVVAYDLPVYREIFAQGIVTVPLKDIKRFSEEVVNLLENDEKRHVLGDKGRSQVTMYDWDSVAARELSLMKNELVQE
jgi:glycosyltransferase involved in cell wall biosynthesis